MNQPTTLEILTHAIPLLEAYDKALIGAVGRDAIMAGQTDIFFQMGLTSPELMASGQKLYTNLFASMKSDMRELVSGFMKTGLNNVGAIGSYNSTMTRAKGIFKKYYKDMFMAGTNAMGNPYYRDLGMTRKDGAFLNKAIRSEMRYMRRFLRDIMNPNHVPRHPYIKRAGYYGESSRAQFLNGMVAGSGKNLDIRWELNMYGSPLTDHCDYCPTYARRLWTWETLPTVPRGGDTPCVYKCFCGLSFIPKKGAPKVSVPGRATAEGMMRMTGRYAHVYDAQGQMVGGQFQAQIEAMYARMYKARQMIEITTGTTQRGWIALRRSLNREVIDMMKNRGYRITPTVSVKALVETIKSAQAAGGTLKSLTQLGIGDEVLFVRGNYSGLGIIVLKKNQVVYQGADGREFVIDDASDLTFVLEKPWKPSGTLEQVEQWAGKSVFKETLYHGTSLVNAEIISAKGFSIEQSKYGMLGKGTYLASNKTTAGRYAQYRGQEGSVLELKINVKNPLTDLNVMTKLENKWMKELNIDMAGHYKIWDKVTEELIKMGYDAIQIDLFGGVTEWCIFNQKNIMVIIK